MKKQKISTLSSLDLNEVKLNDLRAIKGGIFFGFGPFNAGFNIGLRAGYFSAQMNGYRPQGQQVF